MVAAVLLITPLLLTGGYAAASHYANASREKTTITAETDPEPVKSSSTKKPKSNPKQAEKPPSVAQNASYVPPQQKRDDSDFFAKFDAEMAQKRRQWVTDARLVESQLNSQIRLLQLKSSDSQQQRYNKLAQAEALNRETTTGGAAFNTGAGVPSAAEKRLKDQALKYAQEASSALYRALLSAQRLNNSPDWQSAPTSGAVGEAIRLTALFSQKIDQVEAQL